MRWHRRLDLPPVRKPQPPGVKMQPPRQRAAGMRRRIAPDTAIFAVTDNRMSRMRHMNAKLVRPARMRAQRDKRQGRDTRPARSGASRCRRAGHQGRRSWSRRRRARPFNSGSVISSAARRRAGDKRKIGLFHILPANDAVRRRAAARSARQQQQPGRVLVDPVDEPHPVRIVPGKRLQHAVHMARRAGPALNGKAGSAC